MKKKNLAIRSEPLLNSFIQYCNDYPQQRFWQALRNWADAPFVCVSDSKHTIDTFYSDRQDGGLNEEKICSKK